MSPQQQAWLFNLAFNQFCQNQNLSPYDLDSYHMFNQCLNSNNNTNNWNNPQPNNNNINNNFNNNNSFNNNNNLNFNNNINNNIYKNNVNFNNNINNNSNNNFNIHNSNNFTNNSNKFTNNQNNFINNPNNNFINNPNNNFINNPNNNFSNSQDNIRNNPNNNLRNNSNNDFSNNPNNNFSHSQNNISHMNLANNSLLLINQNINNNNFEAEIFNNNGAIYMSESVEEVMPRKEQTLYMNKEMQNQPNTINITFCASTGFNVMMVVSIFMSLEDLFKKYMERLNLPFEHVGKDILFSFNGKIVDYKSKAPIWNMIKKTNSRIEVLDTGNVLGA